MEGGLFCGEVGPEPAYLTFLAEPFTASMVENGNLKLGLDAVGEFAVYLNRSPGASFHDPASFGAGEEVARFRRVSVVVGATVGSGPDDRPLFSLNVFSAQLVSSREFELGGRRYDLCRLMPNGITHGATAATAAVEGPRGFMSGTPFVGSAIAIGGTTGGDPSTGDVSPRVQNHYISG